MILFGKLTAYSQAGEVICLTPNEYRFYAGAVIDRQAMAKDTTRLKEAIFDLKTNNASLESDLAKSRDVEAKMGEKEAIYVHKIDTLSDAVDKYKIKTVRNRRMAIVGGGVSVLETVLIVLGLILIF